MALSGLDKDDALYLEILPTLLTMVTDEYHTQPRSSSDRRATENHGGSDASYAP